MQVSTNLISFQLAHKDLFDPEVRMWVYEEMVEGQKLTEIINTKHVNVKYLPGRLANAFFPSSFTLVKLVIDCIEGKINL